MKILLANKYFFIKGGADNSFFQTANLLEGKGHNVSFFSMNHPRNFPSEFKEYFLSNVDYEDKNVFKNIKAAGRILYSFEAKKKIKKLILKEKPDVAHLNSIYHQISPSIVHTLKKHGVPVVMSLRDYKIVCASYAMLADSKICEACKGGKYYNCFLKKCVKDSRAKSLLNTAEMYLHHAFLSIYDMVDAFISPSQFLKEKVAEMGFKGKVYHLSNFVNLDGFPMKNCPHDNSIVYFGRLSREKGLRTLILAMKDVAAKLKIIGEGPIKADLIKIAQENNIHNVEFLGYMAGEELKDAVRSALFVVLPSEWYENNPRSIIEGFALGKPAIGARIGGIPELVCDHETGLTFESGNIQDLNLKINELLKSPDKIEVMGRNARDKVIHNLSEEMHYSKLMEIYSAVMVHGKERKEIEAVNSSGRQM